MIKPREEIRNNKHRTCIGYEKEVAFHSSNYTKSIQFQSIGLLQEGLYSPAPVQEKILKCQNFHQVGHMKEQCFYIHPCEHCGKHNHPLKICSNHNKYARVKNHYGWMNTWKWSSTIKKIYYSYHRIHSRVLTHIVVKGFSSSHLVPDRRE